MIPHYTFGFRTASRLFMHITSHFEVQGEENIIAPPFVLAVNHLQHTDAFCVAAAMPYEMIALGAEKLKGSLIAKLFSFGAPIWIKQDSPDRKALRQAIDVLKAGYPLAISPEGHRSKKPGLLPGKDGAAFIATRAKVPILPVGICGTEKIFREIRPAVRIKIGKSFQLPTIHANLDDLKYYNEQIMCAIAVLLPENYRGFYAGNPLIEEMRKLVL